MVRHKDGLISIIWQLILYLYLRTDPRAQSFVRTTLATFGEPLGALQLASESHLDLKPPCFMMKRNFSQPICLIHLSGVVPAENCFISLIESICKREESLMSEVVIMAPHLSDHQKLVPMDENFFCRLSQWLGLAKLCEKRCKRAELLRQTDEYGNFYVSYGDEMASLDSLEPVRQLQLLFPCGFMHSYPQKASLQDLFYDFNIYLSSIKNECSVKSKDGGDLQVAGMVAAGGWQWLAVVVLADRFLSTLESEDVVIYRFESADLLRLSFLILNPEMLCALNMNNGDLNRNKSSFLDRYLPSWTGQGVTGVKHAKVLLGSSSAPMGQGLGSNAKEGAAMREFQIERAVLKHYGFENYVSEVIQKWIGSLKFENFWKGSKFVRVLNSQLVKYSFHLNDKASRMASTGNLCFQLRN
ncbi:hypothetical protein M5K25_023025 [Dendrobium thyrsiflorum]|uniref:Uncharacterized protein n=1 Tax=Dendrobium thyrsiflorum TaxID=117978 RepID=A0ABD0U7D1_DENTH